MEDFKFQFYLIMQQQKEERDMNDE